jgi:hypothetical protein
MLLRISAQNHYLKKALVEKTAIVGLGESHPKIHIII